MQLELECKENIKTTAPLGALKSDMSDLPSREREVPTKKTL